MEKFTSVGHKKHKWNTIEYLATSSKKLIKLCKRLVVCVFKYHQHDGINLNGKDSTIESCCFFCFENIGNGISIYIKFLLSDK